MIQTKFVNTDVFREAALHYEEYGYYSNAPVGTLEWENYWDEQKRRSIEGYEVNGVKITGYHYWYLNFCRIQRVSDKALAGDINNLDNDNSIKKEDGSPAFLDGDYNFFWAVDIARNGISKEEYGKLNLKIDIKHLDGNRHLVVLKARRKGYSYKTASMLARNYHLLKGSKGYALAGETEYLDPSKDGLLAKVWHQINFVDNNTPFRQPKLIDRQFEKMSGYKRNIAGTDVERGFKSMIASVSLKDNPRKAHGKDGELIFFEEAGKLPNLLKSWEISRPSVEDGSFTTGLMIAFGTGGVEGSDFSGLQELFYNPDAYNVLPINNIWDEGADGTNCGFFVPDYWNFPGFMDIDGNSDEQKAIDYQNVEREKKKKAPNPGALSQFTAEHPFTPMEASLESSTNIFPIAEIQAQINRIRVHKMEKFGVSGVLTYGDKGRVIFTPSDIVKPISKYPHNPKDNLTGSVVIYQSPFRDKNGIPPKHMYIACHDPYAHNSSSNMNSLGSVHILKRANLLDGTFHDCIVATYTGRPSTQDEFNRILFMLAEYYNCKIAFENDRGNTIQYAKQFKLLSYLQEEFDVILKSDSGEVIQKTNVKRNYGIHMTDSRINQAEIYVRDWLLELMSVSEDGTRKLRLHNIYDIPILEELIKFNKKGNFDRVSALFIGMYYLKELHSKQIVEEVDTPYEDFFLTNTEHFT